MNLRTLLPLIAPLLLGACRSPQRALELRCDKAEQHIAKAVWLCPSVLNTTTVPDTLNLPGDSVSAPLRYADVSTDSVLTACERFAHAMALRVTHLTDSIAAAGGPELPRDDRRAGVDRTAVRNTPTPTKPRAMPELERLRDALCTFEPFIRVQGDIVIQVSPNPLGGEPIVTARLKERSIITQTPCPPQVVIAPEKPKATPWWIAVLDFIPRWVPISLSFLLILLMAGRKPWTGLWRKITNRWR